MNEGAVAIVALVVGLLPVFVIGVVVAGFAICVLGVILFLRLLEEPLRCWMYYASVVLDIVILVPVGLVSIIAKRLEPRIWSEAETPVLILVTTLLAITVLLYYFCSRAKNA